MPQGSALPRVGHMLWCVVRLRLPVPPVLASLAASRSPCPAQGMCCLQAATEPRARARAGPARGAVADSGETVSLMCPCLCREVTLNATDLGLRPTSPKLLAAGKLLATQLLLAGGT